MSERVQGDFYSIDKDKLARIKELTGLTEEVLVDLLIKYDWHEGGYHQAWLDTATDKEIADWVKPLA